MTGYDDLYNHPITKLLKMPNSYQSPTEFKSSIVTSILVNGNAFIKIVRVNGKPTQLYPLDASDITIGSNAFGLPTYTHEDTNETISLEDIIHIKDLQTYTPLGLSRLLQGAEIIGAKMAADRLMSETFKNGISLGYVVRSDGSLDSNSVSTLMDQMQKAFGARGSRRNGVAFIDNGQVEQIKGSTPADIDLRELRQMLITEIAALMRVPPFMAGANADQRYNNVRQYWTAFHRDTLQPIITNIEEAFKLKLLNEDEYLHFDVNKILKGDVEVTGRVMTNLVSNGVITPNEARKEIGMNPSDDESADMLIAPNSTTNTNITPEETPENATGGEDGPQGANNVE